MRELAVRGAASAQGLYRPGPSRRAIVSRSSLTAFFVCSAILITLLTTSDQLFHWFVIPVLLCGLLIGSDAVDWVRGRLDAFDPIGLIGLLGVHVFFLAPLLHVVFDYWMAHITPPEDWRDWLGGMAILNCLGLIAYRAFRGRITSGGTVGAARTKWKIDRKRVPLVLGLLLLVTGALQAWVYIRYGGILGYVSSYVARDGAFQGMGWVFMISESFPVLALLGFAIYAREHRWARTWASLAAVLLLFFVMQMLFGGLRGSRSNTVFALFWAVGIVHLWIRRVPRKILYAGAAGLVLFMYVYGFYKSAGLDVLALSEGSQARLELEERSGRTLEGLLLGDLGRSDVQAFLLYRLWPVPAEFEYAWGRTYLGAASLLIPRSLWPDRPPTKAKEGTEALHGQGAYAPGIFQSSRVYGLAGEAMLNFGPFAVPVVFAVFGAVVRRIRGWFLALAPEDSRVCLYPLLVNFAVILLTSDSDNLVFFLVTKGVVPLLTLWLCSRRVLIRDCRGVR